MEKEIRDAVLKEHFGTEDIDWVERKDEIQADDLIACINLASQKTRKYYLNKVHKFMSILGNCDTVEYQKKQLCPWTPEGCAVFQAMEFQFKSIFRRGKDGNK